VYVRGAEAPEVRWAAVRVAFVYPNPRRQLAEDVAAGNAPDTALLGQNHLGKLGFETWIHEPAVRRKERAAGVRHRLTWNLRELTLPWEVGDADVVVTPLVNLFPLASRLRRSPRVVVLTYGLTTTWARSSRVRRRAIAASLRACAGVACLGSTQRQQLLDLAGVPPERVRVLHIGVDHRFFSPSAGGDGYVLAVGRDLARDYATLAEAAGSLEVEVHIVAEQRNLGHVDLPGNVRVHRGVSWSGLRDLYAGARCVALPLRRPEYPFGTEGSGLTAIVEAMAMAKPVAVSERPIFGDYVKPDESALVVPPEDPAALAGALERILADDELAERLGRRGRALVEERFSTHRFAEELAGFLTEIHG
jgi:glycosyltransferase involved in cell wall biosynthesis